MGSSYLNVQIYSDGWVRWMPSMIFESTCAVNIKYFPFDTQKCDLKITAWSYRKFEVQINKGLEGVVLDHYVQNAAWDLVSATSQDVSSDEVAVVFTLHLKRKPLFFLFNIIGPVILLSILNVFTFVLPVESGDKAGYSITVFLALAVFLTIISDQLPNNSDTVSLMAIYLSTMVLLSTVVVVVCIIQIRLSIRKETEQPITCGYASIVKLANCLQCRRQMNQNKIKPDNIVKERSLDDIDEEPEVEAISWIDVVHAMDFLCFWLAAIYTFVCTTAIACSAVSNS
ncbi:acetylcholine receptor subunit delta-like [Ruditapes philippinarum]|uniref:acetylcholine receptor subunit delta-like n=1 Tax=Ruditapes philippinarum TaxID=129788 RepID=UPI00295B3BD0|nr:acetylcholine receptor subunit delta-like [Ruditapes philippinarum]